MKHIPQNAYLIELVSRPDSSMRTIYADFFNIDAEMMIFYNIIDDNSGLREFVCAYPCREIIINKVIKKEKRTLAIADLLQLHLLKKNIKHEN